MSGSEAGGAVMASREAFTLPAPQPVIQNLLLAYGGDGAAVFKPVAGSSPPYQPASGGDGSSCEGSAAAAVVQHNLNLNVGEPAKKKRGRPRKYGPDGSMALALATVPSPATGPHSTGAFSAPAAPSGGCESAPWLKKARGRPPGSSKKQQLEALGTAGVGFTPHVITVKAGEDVSSKIMSFSQHGPRAVCILSANGAISNVTLWQAATFGGTATYEGRFDILSLSGSFLLTEVAGQRSRTGGLSVSLAGQDGRVLGGSVAGLLTAATPVQVVVGSFIADGQKEPKPLNRMESLPIPLNLAPVGGVMGASSPPSRGTLSESSDGHGSPLNQSAETYYSNLQGMSSMPWK